MIATTLWLALLNPAQAEQPKPEPAIQAAIEPEQKGEDPDHRNRRLGAARLLMPDIALLTALSILLLFLGGVMIITRFGRRVKRHPERKPVKYFDMTVGDGPDPPPHEPSAEERLGGREDGN